MRETFTDLSECRELALALRARPPLLVHGALWMAAALLGSALLWAGLTQADLVVRAGGRMRPVNPPTKVYYTTRGDGSSAGLGGRVVSVGVKPGDEVKAGGVLLRRDTERLDNEIARRRRTLQSAEEELANLEVQGKLQARQSAAAKAKAAEEVALAEAEVDLAKKSRAADVRLAEAELAGAAEEVARARRLLVARAGAAESLDKARTAHGVAEAKLERARLAVDEGKVRVARQALAVLEREAEQRREELAGRRTQKRGEAEAARLELANLELERKEAVLRSPVDGVVTAGEVHVGDVLEPGKCVMEVAERRGLLFEALVPSEEMANVRVGMPARVRLDAFDYQRYGTLTGRVSYVAPDSTTKEGQAAVGYVVRVEVDGDEVGVGELRGRAQLGMAGLVEVVTDRQSLLFILLRKIRQTISLG